MISRFVTAFGTASAIFFMGAAFLIDTPFESIGVLQEWEIGLLLMFFGAPSAFVYGFLHKEKYRSQEVEQG